MTGTVQPEIAPSDLLAQIEAGAAPTILDVRSRREFASGHIPGAFHVPFWSLYTGSPEIPVRQDDRIIVYCAYGPRARLAGAALRSRGFRRVVYLQGHMARWRQAGYRQEQG